MLKSKKVLIAALMILFATPVCGRALSLGDNAEEHLSFKKGDKFELRVIAYNVCGLAEFLTAERNLGPMKKRFAYIGEKLRKYDIVALQEMFEPDRIIIEKKLGSYYVSHGADTMRGGKVGSGVYTFSRKPITGSLYNRWKIQEGPDAVSHKGFVGVRTSIPGGPEIDVYNLHAQAGGPEQLRINNYNELLEGMKYFSFGSGRPIILLGDFNCRYGEPECDHLFKITGMTDLFPSAKEVDHIFYIENGSGWNVTSLDNNVVFDELVNGQYVSDHTALEATLIFEKVK